MKSRGKQQGWFASLVIFMFVCCLIGITSWAEVISTTEVLSQKTWPQEVGRMTQPDTWVETKSLVGNGIYDWGIFGASVAVDGDIAVVGAPSGNRVIPGFVYIFERGRGDLDHWQLVQEISGASGFGSEVDISNDTIIATYVSYYPPGTPNGAAYIYSRQGPAHEPWVRTQVLDAGPSRVHGEAVAIDAGIIVSTATHWFNPPTIPSLVYIYKRSVDESGEWEVVDIIEAPDGHPEDYFGDQVAIQEETIAVGASAATINGNLRQGAVYIFEQDDSVHSWSLTQKLTSSDGSSGDRFGWSVAVNSDFIAIGAPGALDGQGAAYLFTRDTLSEDDWYELVQLLASDGRPEDSFGSSVTISDDFVFVGDPTDSGEGDYGSVYVFWRSEAGPKAWPQVQKLAPTASFQSRSFGFSLAVDNDMLIVGRGHSDEIGTSTHIFAPLSGQQFFPVAVRH